METRNLEIDRLRAVAVIMTVFCHLDMVTFGQGEWYPFLSMFINGSDGVILFFAISGYVISKTLINEIESASRFRDALKGFWIKRLTRITPMTLLWIGIPLLATLYLNGTHIFGDVYYNVHGAVAAALNIFNVYSLTPEHQKSIFGVYWSLSLEEQFYLIFPFFLLFFRTWNQRLVTLIMVLILLDLIPSHIRPAFRMEAIVLGIIIYLLTSKFEKKESAYPKQLMVVFSTFLIVLVALVPTTFSWMPNYLYYPINPLVSAALVWLAVQNKGYILPFSRISAVMDWIGTRSFGLYLIHIPAFKFAFAIMSGSPHNTPFFRGVTSIILLIALTEVSYRMVEVPIRRWGRNIANQRTEGKVNKQPKKRREIGVSA